MIKHAENLQRFLRRRAVQELTGLPTSSLYAMIASGKFPAPIRLSSNRVAWLSRDIATWQAERIAAGTERATKDG